VADCAVAASLQDVRFVVSSMHAMKVMMRLLQVKVVLVSIVAASGLQIIVSESWNRQGDVVLAESTWLGATSSEMGLCYQSTWTLSHVLYSMLYTLLVLTKSKVHRHVAG
jgi:hypothetical protein